MSQRRAMLSGRGAKIRMLAIQSVPMLTSEVRVFHALLRHIEHAMQATGVTLEVMVVQGVDRHAGSARGWEAARSLATFPDVSVHEIHVGRLGQQDVPARARLAKVADLAILRVAQRDIFRLVHSFQPHVVYSSQQVWDLRLAAPIVRPLRCAQVVHLHYTAGPELGGLAAESLPRATCVLAVSDFIRNSAARFGVPEERIHILHNTVDVSPPLPDDERAAIRNAFRRSLSLPAESLLIGMTARLNPLKGQEDLARAAIPLLQRDPSVHLVLAGRENPSGNGTPERVMKQAAAGGVARQIHLLGERADVPMIMEALDVFAHPSHDEPFGLAIAEAMSHELPVVAWREGGPAELIVPGETGLLAEPLDIGGLTRALESLLLDEDMRARMGSRGKRRIQESFNPAQASATFLELIAEAVEQADGRLQAPLAEWAHPPTSG